MKMLLDTCTLIWLVSDPNRLSHKAIAALNDQEKRIYLSDVSVWEICLKWQAEKIKLPSPSRLWIEEQCMHWGIIGIPIVRSHVYRMSELPEHHRDPFDRLIVAQSIEEKLTIVTPDKYIHAYPVATLW